jgi:hypothetical protein
MLLVRIATAHAQDCATPFSEFEVRALVDASEGALFNDDLLTHKQLFAEFVRRAPCLNQQLPKDAWAQLLLDEAIVRFTAKGVWQPLLETALQIFPDLEVPKYLRDQHVRPADQKYGEAPIPEDATLFVDGVLQPRIPLLVGEHVVQVWRDGRWRSVYLDGATPFPAEWLVPKPKEVIEVEKVDGAWVPVGRGAVGVGFGVLVTNQFVEGEGTYLPDARLIGGSTVVSSHGFQPVSGTPGVFWDGSLRIVVPSVRRLGGTPTFDTSPDLLPIGYFGPALVLENSAFGLGGGAFVLQKVEGGVVYPGVYPQVHVTAEGRSGRGTFELGGGFSPSAAHGSMRGGWVLTDVEPLSVQFGFDTNLDVVWFTEAPPGERGASVLQLGGLARIDVVWGADR